MQTKETQATSKSQQWKKAIAGWQRSGLSQQAYCTQHQLVYANFVYWRRRLRQDKTAISGKVKFLSVLKRPSGSSLKLHINGRHRIDIDPDFDPTLLRQVIKAMEASHD